MKIQEAELNDALLETLVALSGDWEAEHSTWGYYKNTREDIAPNRIFLAEEGGRILGYLLGSRCHSEKASSIMAENTPFFEIEELYVLPELRGRGIGRQLFSFAEETVKAEGLEYLMLSTATKDYKAILHFYIEELGMDFWSARLFKKL